MKIYLLLLLFIPFLFFTGCRENNITDPLSEPAGDKKLSGPNWDGFFELNQILPNPHNVEVLYKLQGTISYDHEFRLTDPVPGLPDHLVILSLSINAALISADPPGQNLTITGTSQDVIYVSEEGISILDKVFPVSGANELNLFCRFIVTTDGVSLNSVTLQ
jgi:hypothetical protein